MASLRSHVGVQTGDGLVARLGPVVLLAAAGDPDEVFTTALVAALEAGVEQTPPLAPRELAWILVDAARSHRGADTAFGALVSTPDGYAVLLHGRTRASVEGVDGVLELRGDTALTLVDHLVTEPMTRATVTLANGPVAVDARLDLRDGLVPGCGFVLTPAAGVEIGVAPETASELPAFAPAQPDADPLVDSRVPALPDPPKPPRRPVPETSLVAPVSSMLLSDDGHRILLDRPYVLGREPHIDDSVAQGAASPVPVRDPDNLISRVQAYVWITGEEVFVRDAHSANGTFIAAPGAEDWSRLGREAVPLPLGWSLRMGRQTFTHVDHRS